MSGIVSATLQAMVAASLTVPVMLQPVARPEVAPTATLQAMVVREPAPVSASELRAVAAPVVMPVVSLVPLKPAASPVPTPTTQHFGVVVNPTGYLAPLPPPRPVMVEKKAAFRLPLPLGRREHKTLVPAGTPVPVMVKGSTPATAVQVATDMAASPNPNVPVVARPEDEMVLVQLIVNGNACEKLMEIYVDAGQQVWLPLAPLAEALQIQLSVNAAAGLADGWYLRTDNPLAIDLAAGTVVVGKQQFAVNGQVERHATDLYLSGKGLEEWLKVKNRLDYQQLQLVLTTPEPLPDDAKAARAQAWQDLSHQLAMQAMPSDTIYPAYSNFSLPVFRLGANSTITKPSGGSAAVATGLTLQSENDVLGMSSNLTLSLANQPDGRSGLVGGNVLVQKQSEQDDLLGPLHARYFGFGDVNGASIPLSNVPSSGRGVRINNRSLTAVSNPDAYVITGPAPVGWDVEIYQDQSLFGFTKIDGSGVYRFTALPLKVGLNTFRLVMYGPNGERQEKRETLYLGDDMPSPGELQYDAMINQPNKQTVPGLPGQTTATVTIAQSQFSYGLTKNLALTVGGFKALGDVSGTNPLALGSLPEEGASAGLRGSYGRTYMTADAFSGNQGQSLQATVRSALTDKIDVRFVQAKNFGYDPVDRDEVATTAANLSAPINIGTLGLSTDYGVARTTYQTQAVKTTYSQRTAFGRGKFNVANELDYEVQGGQGLLQGTLDTTSHVGNQMWRASLLYQPGDKDLLHQLTVGTQLPVTRRQTLNLTYTQSLLAGYDATLAGSMYWTVGPMAIGLQSSLTRRGDMQMGVNLTTALMPQDYETPKWALTSPNATIGQGQARIRVFADANGNGIYDAGEALLQGVTVNNRQRGSDHVTNVQGIAVVPDLTPFTLSRLQLAQDTLPDIYLKPVSDTLNVKAHPGDNGTLDYAVRVYGEVSGQVEVLNAGGKRPLQNLTLKIYNNEGRALDSTDTAYDGYYNFGALPLGTYTLAAVNLPSGTTFIASPTFAITAQQRIKTLNLAVSLPEGAQSAPVSTARPVHLGY